MYTTVSVTFEEAQAILAEESELSERAALANAIVSLHAVNAMNEQHIQRLEALLEHTKCELDDARAMLGVAS